MSNQHHNVCILYSILKKVVCLTKQMKKISCLILFLVLLVNAKAQQVCDFEEQMQNFAEQNPILFNNYLRTYEAALNAIYSQNKRTVYDTTIYIPVIFHVLYNSSINASEQDLDAIINILNLGFNAQLDTSSVRNIYKERVANVSITCYRPKVDLNGDSILKTDKRYSNYSFNDPNDAKSFSKGGLNAYEPSRFLNIWVARINGLYGHGTPPVGASYWHPRYFYADSLQGIVLNHSIVSNQSSSTFQKNKHIVIHEVGHFLGLKHIWGDGIGVSNQDTSYCTEDDGIKDTPKAFYANYACDYTKNTCVDTSSVDLPDMIENFMDYTASDCRVMFTADQKALMLYNLYTYRPLIYKTVITKREKLEMRHRIAVYPNPTTGNFSIDLPSYLEDTNCEFTLTNYLGQRVWNQTKLAEIHNTFSIEGLVNGSYSMQISNQLQYSIVLKLVVVND